MAGKITIIGGSGFVETNLSRQLEAKQQNFEIISSTSCVRTEDLPKSSMRWDSLIVGLEAAEYMLLKILNHKAVLNHLVGGLCRTPKFFPFDLKATLNS